MSRLPLRARQLDNQTARGQTVSQTVRVPEGRVPEGRVPEGRVPEILEPERRQPGRRQEVLADDDASSSSFLKIFQTPMTDKYK